MMSIWVFIGYLILAVFGIAVYFVIVYIKTSIQARAWMDVLEPILFNNIFKNVKKDGKEEEK